MKEKTTSTPHDAVFKQFLCHPDTARDFLDIHLPPTLRDLCDLGTLTLESTTFIEENLRSRYSDVLWSLKTRDGAGYIYVVIEHQSSAEAHMAFRMMRYALAAMHRHLEAGYDELPLVVPMLFYHGIRTPYPFSLCWLDEFADPALARSLYTSAFPLVDITVVPDDEIMQHRRIALLELMQKHIRQRNLMGLVERLAALLVKGYANDSQVKSLFNYMLQSGDEVRFNDFIRGITEHTPQHKEKMMTIADRLRQEGHQNGLQEGLQQGLLQGKQEGLRQGKQEGQRAEALRIARTMLAQGIEPDVVLLVTALSADDLKALNH